MKKIVTLFLILMTGQFIQAGPADTLSLRQCLELSMARLPFNTLMNTSDGITELTSDISGLNWYPSMSLNASATYQSEVTSIPLEIPGIDIPTPTKDQYGIYLEVRQIVYDAGMTKAKLELDLLAEQIRKNELDIRSRNIRESAASAFFALKLIRSRMDILDLAGKDLEEQYQKALAMYNDGVIPKRNLLDMEAARIAWKQQLIELQSAEQAGLAVLSVMTGLNLDTGTLLRDDEEFMVVEDEPLMTPEIKAFRLREMQADASSLLAGKKRLPRASVFGRAGYGRPGLNMLSDEFSGYYLLGAGLSWTPWDWGQVSREQDIASLRKQEVQANFEIYLNSMNIRQEKLKAEMDKYPLLITQADTLIQIRKEIREASAAAMEEGTLTSTEYLADHNSYVRALIEKETYRIAWSQAIVNYLLLTGKL